MKQLEIVETVLGQINLYSNIAIQNTKDENIELVKEFCDYLIDELYLLKEFKIKYDEKLKKIMWFSFIKWHKSQNNKI